MGLAWDAYNKNKKIHPD